MGNKITKSPQIRFAGFKGDWEQRRFSELFEERRDKTKVENEDTLLSCAINGMFLNTELFGHFRGSSTIGYLKVKKNDLILSAQNLHLGNANVNQRFEHGIISPAYKVYELIDSEPNFIQAWVKRDETKNFFLAATTEGASQCRKNIEWDRLYKQTMFIPVYKEQEAIGTFFLSLDTLITFYQRKVELLKQTKKSLLQKMFPQDGANVPEIRFAGFTDAWEQRKLSELMEFSNGINAPKENYGKGRKMISVMDILADEPIIYENIRNSVEVDNTTESKNKVENGDLVFVRSSEVSNEVGWAKAYQQKKYALYSGFSIRGKKKDEFDAKFIELSLNYTNRKQIESRAGGSTRFNISQSILSSIVILEPTNEEQIKIGYFFKKIEEIIALHQRELKSLGILKKSLLQQMFI